MDGAAEPTGRPSVGFTKSPPTLDPGIATDHHPGVDEDELDPREAARARRRDHDMDAQRRDLMRPGMGKVWKQVQDAWVKEPVERRRRERGIRH